jgi:nucleoside-diphosphate-sugar epimerase
LVGAGAADARTVVELLASPFVATFREMREIRYLWQRPVRMDNTRLLSVLGAEPHTPLDEALDKTLGEGPSSLRLPKGPDVARESQASGVRRGP